MKTSRLFGLAIVAVVALAACSKAGASSVGGLSTKSISGVGTVLVNAHDVVRRIEKIGVPAGLYHGVMSSGEEAWQHLYRRGPGEVGIGYEADDRRHADPEEAAGPLAPARARRRGRRCWRSAGRRRARQVRSHRSWGPWFVRTGAPRSPSTDCRSTRSPASRPGRRADRAWPGSWRLPSRAGRRAPEGLPDTEVRRASPPGSGVA